MLVAVWSSARNTVRVVSNEHDGAGEDDAVHAAAASRFQMTSRVVGHANQFAHRLCGLHPDSGDWGLGIDGVGIFHWGSEGKKAHESAMVAGESMATGKSSITIC